MASDHWIQGAVKRPGAFSRKARDAGMSTQAYARKVESDPHASTRTKRQAALARNFARMNKRRHHRSPGRK